MFLPGNVGYAYDFTSASLNYQENTRTNLVTTPGHSIGSATDLSGLGNHAAQATAAQRPAYQGTCRFVGSDDSLATPAVDFTGTSKITVLIKLKSNSNATVHIPLELSVASPSNSGTFFLEAPNTSTNRYALGVRGAATSGEVRLPGQVAPVTNMIVAQLDVSQATILGQINVTISPSGGAATTNGTASVAANFGNYISYIGRRGGTTAPFNGDIDRLIVIGRALTAPELAAATTWIASSSAPALHGAITDRVVVARRGDQLYVRTKWTSTVDLVQRVALANGVSSVPYMVNFMGARLVANSEIDAQAGFNSATGANILAAQSDDATPCEYNGTFIGANHGSNSLYRFPKTAHGKTVEDIGSVWTDGASSRWVLMTIVDANTLEFISENQSVYPAWSFRSSISGTTMTHASGATHTTAITASSSITQYQLYPAVNNATKQALLDGVTDIASAADGIYTCDSFKVVHNYSITNPADVVRFAKDRVGSAVAPDYADNGIDTDMRLNIDYTFTPNHACTVQHSVEAMQDVTLNYIGFLQSVKLTNSGTDVLWAYVPRSLSVSGFDFKAQQNMTGFASNVSFTSATWEDAANPPASQTFIVKNSGGTKQFSYTHAYTPDKTIGVPATRLTLTSEACRFASTGKAYMTGINGSGSAFPGGILPQGASYSVTGVRAFINNVQDWPHGPEAYWYRDGNDVVVVLDFDTTQSNITFTLPAWMNGKTASVIENSGTFTCHSATASNGIVVSQSGAAGRGIVRLT